MDCVPESVEIDIRLLDREWARIGLMITLAEALRTGADLDDKFSATFAAAGEAVTENRARGAWSRLAGAVDASHINGFLQIDLDILALALAPPESVTVTAAR